MTIEIGGYNPYAGQNNAAPIGATLAGISNLAGQQTLGNMQPAMAGLAGGMQQSYPTLGAVSAMGGAMSSLASGMPGMGGSPMPAMGGGLNPALQPFQQPQMQPQVMPYTGQSPAWLTALQNPYQQPQMQQPPRWNHDAMRAKLGWGNRMPTPDFGMGRNQPSRAQMPRMFGLLGG